MSGFLRAGEGKKQRGQNEAGEEPYDPLSSHKLPCAPEPEALLTARTPALRSMPTLPQTRAPTKPEIPILPQPKGPNFFPTSLHPRSSDGPYRHPTALGGRVGPLTGAPRPSQRTA